LSGDDEPRRANENAAPLQILHRLVAVHDQRTTMFEIRLLQGSDGEVGIHAVILNQEDFHRTAYHVTTHKHLPRLASTRASPQESLYSSLT